MSTWQGYLSQSRKFWDVAQAADDPEHMNQAVSNAVHAVIAANDALCISLLGRRSSGTSHRDAAHLLQAACRGTQWEREAAARSRQYSQIVSIKNAAEYEGVPLSPETAQRIMTQSKRFLDWIECVLTDV